MKITKFAVFPMLFLLWITVGNPQAASAAHSGFAWANDEASALNVPYIPNAYYAYNSTGGAITITRTGTGLYTVKFSGLGAASTGATNGGNVQVATYIGFGFVGAHKAIAKVVWWDSVGSDFIVYLKTQKANGPAGNSKFSVSVTVP